MITTGYWCDECRVKYVRYIGRGGLPCGHRAPLYVACQAFARSGEHVIIGRENVWLFQERKPDTCYGRGAIQFWGTRVTPFRPEGNDPPEWYVGEWLASKPDRFVRAFLERWQSCKEIPDWLAFRRHPAARRACALVKRLPDLRPSASICG